MCKIGDVSTTWQDVPITVFSRCNLRSECLNPDGFLGWLPYSGAQCTRIVEIMPDQVQITPNSVSRVSTLRSLGQCDHKIKLVRHWCIAAMSNQIHLIHNDSPSWPILYKSLRSDTIHAGSPNEVYWKYRNNKCSFVFIPRFEWL